jgi:hypothetical protein
MTRERAAVQVKPQPNKRHWMITLSVWTKRHSSKPSFLFVIAGRAHSGFVLEKIIS